MAFGLVAHEHISLSDALRAEGCLEFSYACHRFYAIDILRIVLCFLARQITKWIVTTATHSETGDSGLHDGTSDLEINNLNNAPEMPQTVVEITTYYY